MTDDTQRGVKLPVVMGRDGWRRDAPHTATVGALTGRGSSQAKALADLGSLITDALRRGAPQAGGDAVTFAWDAANANLWIAVPDVLNGGAHEYVVDCSGQAPANPYGGGSRAGRARDAFTHSAGMAMLADRPQLPPMPAEVRDMLSRASDAMGELPRYRGTLGDHESARAALSDLADYVSGLYAPSELAR